MALDVSVAVNESSLIGDALAQHYVAHGLPADGGAADQWFRVRIGPFNLRLPNPPARRRAVFFHDVNHIVTGYNTTFSDGEMAIAGFEVGAGCDSLWMVWFINLSMLALGLVACPHAVFAAFVRGRRSASIYHVYHRQDHPAGLSAMSVAHVRAQLRLGGELPAPASADRLAFTGWAIIAIMVLSGPAALLLAALWASLHIAGALAF